MNTQKPSGYLVTFLDGLGHEKEMIFLKERLYNAEDAAARLHGTCHPLYKGTSTNNVPAPEMIVVGD